MLTAPESRAPRYPRLGTVLFLANLVVMVLPLGGILLLRIYESALIRQTETELIAQGAFVSALYQEALQNAWGASLPPPGFAVRPLPEPRRAALAALERERWRPRPAELDLAEDEVLPPPQDSRVAAIQPDGAALVAGRRLEPLLKTVQTVTLAGIRVTDANGVVVASTGEELGRSLAHREEIARALDGEEVSLMRSRLSETPSPPLASISRGANVRVSVAGPVILGGDVVGAVLLIRTPRDILQALHGKRRVLLLGALLLIAVAGALTLATSLTITRPVRALIRQAARAEAGEQGAVTPLARPGTAEIMALSEAVARMAVTLERRATYIRDFANHVSHEFKTPLTAMRGVAELLADPRVTAEERAQLLATLEASIERLDRLVRRLLDLARADMAAPGQASCDPAAVLRRIAERSDGGIAVELSMPSALPPIAMADPAFEGILAQLVDNARQHGARHVAISAGIENDALAVLVADDGPGISSANRERIFEPFFTTARATGGTGLGLPIVQSLLRAHGGGIRLVGGDEPGGASFDLSLPLARQG